MNEKPKGLNSIQINISDIGEVTAQQIFAKFSRNFWRMRSSLVVRASDCQCTSCNGPGFDPNIRRHSGILGPADDAVFNIVQKNPPK
jgi:hypothetical protein